MQQIEITVIRPEGRWISFDLRDLWRHRELLYFLTWRDIKVRYKQTLIGVAWAVLQPLITTAVFTIIFSRFAGFSTGSVPYPLFALSGLMLWLFVHGSITLSSNSFVNNPNLVTKVYFPRLIMPLAATLAGLFDLLFVIGILIIMMIYYGTVPGPQLALAPIFVVLAFVQAAALGTLFAALNIRFRDVKFALPFLLQVWMIASPIFYPVALLSDRAKLVFALNPMTGIIEGFRSSLFDLPFDSDVIGISCVSLLILSVFSLFVFRRMEDDFADVI
jgi:lipopolysaccharide transport system permease protein